MKKAFGVIENFFRISGYARDAALLSAYTGIRMTRDEYGQYRRNGYKISDSYSPMRQVEKVYHLFCEMHPECCKKENSVMPSWKETAAIIGCDMLKDMHDNGVTISPQRLQEMDAEIRAYAQNRRRIDELKMHLGHVSCD